MAEQVRADQLLVQLGLASSRSRAQSLIKAGKVFAGTAPVSKPSEMFETTETLRLEGEDHPWVSRGGLKLAHALAHFNLKVDGFVCLDVGASTGGFTDVLLSAGAARVYAVDVGSNQLAGKLRGDVRVISLEQLNAKDVTATHVPEPVDLIVCDASFISLTKVLPVPLSFAKSGARLVALIKPQFEVGKNRLGKDGVVKDEALHEEVCASITSWLNAQSGWQVEGLTPSPVLGPAGNREFLIVARRR